MAGFGVPDYSGVSGNIDTSLLPDSCTVFTNCRLCINGRLTQKPSSIIFSNATGRIIEVLPDINIKGGRKATATCIDLNGSIVAPGLLELQTNGMRGFHFTHFQDEQGYRAKIDDIARYLVSTGVTGFWATIPTVEKNEFKKVGIETCSIWEKLSDFPDLAFSLPSKYRQKCHITRSPRRGSLSAS